MTRRAPLRALAAALFALSLLLPAVRPALAAEVTFGTPAAKAVYTNSITFSVPVTLAAAPARVELWITMPDTLGPYIVTVDAPSSGGSRTLEYRMDVTGNAFLVPNTRLGYQWAVYPASGGDPVMSQPASVHYKDTAHDWHVLKGDLVTFYWYEGSDSFAQKALKIGEDAVRETANLLGVTETEPIDFYAYGDEASFREAMGPGTRENVGGRSHADIRTMFALLTPSEIGSSWVGIVIPHELTHLVFDSAVRNPYRFPPRWVNEGLATYLSEGFTPTDQGYIKDAIRNGDLLPLTALTGQFPTDPSKTYLAYSESVSAIDYLVKTFGKDAMLSLVTSYKDGLTDDEALTRATGTGLADFQTGWLKSLGAQAPTQYGPQPNPPGPVPPGWDQPIPTANPGASGEPAPATGAPGTPAPTATAKPGGGTAIDDGGSDGMLVVGGVVVVFVVLIAWLASTRRGRRTL